VRRRFGSGRGGCADEHFDGLAFMRPYGLLPGGHRPFSRNGVSREESRSGRLEGQASQNLNGVISPHHKLPTTYRRLLEVKDAMAMQQQVLGTCLKPSAKQQCCDIRYDSNSWTQLEIFLDHYWLDLVLGEKSLNRAEQSTWWIGEQEC
jgi:hypothetical protein